MTQQEEVKKIIKGIQDRITEVLNSPRPSELQMNCGLLAHNLFDLIQHVPDNGTIIIKRVGQRVELEATVKLEPPMNEILIKGKI